VPESSYHKSKEGKVREKFPSSVVNDAPVQVVKEGQQMESQSEERFFLVLGQRTEDFCRVQNVRLFDEYPAKPVR
jgi:hypothetical protein